ncbi:hypothetical protein [Phenylobacterium sp.]|uniref:hypothetical protein n=1 Tax=Phenylobacterium sp. TaxID=1871053 RepID=UPI00273228AA|nr:hypothetical protein [Phenylobacterium sp.]MDP2213765.1 hypothetical protein [Phenylobacterium sp.]
MIGFDSNLLVNYYQSKLGGVGGASSTASGGVARKYAPTAPWSPQATPVDTSALLKAALQGSKLIDESAATLDLAGASSDYKKLFALYQGLATLTSLAERANAKNLTSFDSARVLSAFTKGMAELTNYVNAAKFDNVRLGFAEVADTARATVGIARAKTEYVTQPLVTGVADGPVPAFAGDVKFDISIQQINTSLSIHIDLAEMGAQTRTLPNVINHINAKLEAAGVTTRFAQERIPGAERSYQSGGKTIKLAPSPDQWAMKIKTDITEKVTFSAVETAPAIYLTQKVGDPDPDGKPDTKDGVQFNQLLKFQTETGAVAAPLQPAGEANWVEGRIFAKPLEGAIETVRATQVGPDGSVYILADISGATGGQSIKGDRDVALMKYDSAGKLLYTRVLGASENAKGLALAVSADGQVAVAGSVTGGLNGSVDGPLNSSASAALTDKSDSFVTVFNDKGEELWTARRGARLEDEASQIAFGSDGTLYVAGRSKSTMPGTTALGGWDSYVEAFSVNGQGVAQPQFTQSFGTAGDDRPVGLVVDGDALVTATIENGRAVIRRFDISGGTPVQVAMRDLGDLEGGTITGLALDNGQLIIAGSTRNTALDAGTVTRAHAGGVDAFAAQISADLSLGPTDAVAYYGGAGDDQAAGLAVSAGQVWITGQAGGALPGHTTMGKADGFLARLDIAAGAVAWSQQFTGKEGHAVPGAIAIAQQGASVLDRLGLPSGELKFSDSAKLTSVSALRPGDQFNIIANGGRPKAITIAVDETLESLMLKIRRETGFQVKVETTVTEGVRRLQIKPLNARSVIELSPGKTGQDALAILGLKEGIVRASKIEDGKTVSADGKADFFGLGLHSGINLGSPEQIRHAISELTQAQGVIRKIYTALRDAATPKNVLAQRAAASSGQASAYMTSRIANYQAALDRLTGGG